MPFVTEGGFGAFSKDPAKIADTVSRWLRDDSLLAKMSSKAKEASRPQVRGGEGKGAGTGTGAVCFCWRGNLVRKVGDGSPHRVGVLVGSVKRRFGGLCCAGI